MRAYYAFEFFCILIVVATFVCCLVETFVRSRDE